MEQGIMVAILGLKRIQVKGEIVRIVTEMRREGRRSFRDQEQTTLHSWCTC